MYAFHCSIPGLAYHCHGFKDGIVGGSLQWLAFLLSLAAMLALIYRTALYIDVILKSVVDLLLK